MKMNNVVNNIFKCFILWLIGGFIYYHIEIFYRGYSHWTMFVLGGLVFVVSGGINEFLSWETPLWKQGLISSAICTGLEFVVGCICNLWLNMHIWDYSSQPLNILGQICPQFFFLWLFLLTFVAIPLDDFLRWKLFDEEKSHYKFINNKY